MADHGDHHGHPALQHHYDSMPQQVEAGKLGMWLFLATEILLFSGLFCAYAVYRTTHPEVFEFASKYLDTTWGAINTLVLIASSWTVALAVRAAQTNKRQQCVFLLGATLVGAAAFMGIKAVEYNHKFHDDLMWGLRFDPANNKPREVHWEADKARQLAESTADTEPAARQLGGGPVAYDAPTPGADLDSSSAIPTPPLYAQGGSEVEEPKHPKGYDPKKVRNVHIFFGIYFCMTGLHGLHVIIGAFVIAWVMWRANRGDFSREYYLPVDLAGLYWHIVDLIWIFLFPLLYLIG